MLLSLPSLVLIALAWIYLVGRCVAVVAGIFYGIKPAVAAINARRRTASALGRLKKWRLLAATAAGCAILLPDVPFPLIVLARGTSGFYRRTAGADDIRKADAPMRVTWRSRHH